MQSVLEIKREFISLDFEKKIEMLKFVNNIVKREMEAKISLKDAAQKMKIYYEMDKELTAFSSLEGDFYEEG
jgi:hypothetical protein